MTVKGISIAVNKKERSIHNWIKKLSAINAQVSAKIAQAALEKLFEDSEEEEI